ncbi:hypothetical protein BKA65DRAFT_482965 [Rhexocercosporidium sp. MPI-PUGE-AT-0058]|nr:hypothetical protein BKA65DRAFT_482965 [Rhexocercosporidium sp. MPI-PUGE-AT-0058]
MTVYWTSTPTPAQALLLKRGIYDFPDIEVNEADGIYTKSEHQVNKLHGGILEVFNIQKHTVSGLIGIGVLGTSQQFYNEPSKVLYGTSTFVINTATAHSVTNLNGNNHLYPGFPNRNWTPAIARDNARRIQKFMIKGRQPTFSKYDPLLSFLRTIGPHCASLIKFLRSTENSRLRSIACPTCLHAADKHESNEWTWAMEDDREDGVRISDIVERVVMELPNLKCLQGGENVVPWVNPVEDPEEVEDLWGVAVNWSDFVRDREGEGGGAWRS